MTELGSLSQSARKSSLKGARGILIFLGAATMLANLALVIFAESYADSIIENERRNLPPGMVLDPAAVEVARADIIKAVRVSGLGFAAVGVLFLIGAVKIYDYPVPITVISLVLYLGGNAVTAMFDPAMVAQGFILKIIIIVALGKAISTALAYERERKSSDQTVDEVDAAEESYSA